VAPNVISFWEEKAHHRTSAQKRMPDQLRVSDCHFIYLSVDTNFIIGSLRQIDSFLLQGDDISLDRFMI